MTTVLTPNSPTPEHSQAAKWMKGSEAVVRCLLEEKVEYLFGYPGGAIMPVYDSLYDFQDKINHILTRHEQGAIHAAQGYARANGKVGVVIATSGPGATNLVTGLADALIDSTPLVCITGQVFSHLLGTDAFQETDVIGISTPVTKWNIQVTRAEDIAPAMSKAFYIARTGRPGPVLVDITKDAQNQPVSFVYEKCKSIRSYQPYPMPSEDAVKKAARLINEAKRPYIVFGQGVILGQAEHEFRNFVEKSGIPAAWTILGLSALPTDHPLNVGMLGMHGNYAPNVLTNECDVLIAIGMRFDDRVTGDVKRYAKQAKIIHFEIDPAEVDKIIKTDVAIIGDCKESLQMIYPHILQKKHEDWLKRFRDLDKVELEKVITSDLFPTQGPITMGESVRLISEKTKGQAILVTDVGQHQMVGCRYMKFDRTRSNITSGGLGTMGFCLPAAMGAKLGAPDREVVAVIGDGGFQMTIQELGTVFQGQIPVKIVILNNEFLGMVRQWQELFFERRYSFTELVNPNFVAVAAGFGIPGEKVSARENLSAAIDRMLATPGPYLLEICVKKEDNVFPMVPAGASISDIRLS